MRRTDDLEGGARHTLPYWACYDLQVSPAEGLETALQLFDLGVEMLRARLRRETPGISEHLVDDAVRAWLHTRPGAEHGDAVGHLVVRNLDP